MADHSPIEWTDATWNPVTGCTKVSPGCAHCYAERLVHRFASTFPRGFRITLRPEALTLPQHWRRPRMVFVNSMSDLFHPDVPDAFIADVFQVMTACPQHTFQILTKRPDRLAQLASHLPWPKNIWAGVSVESSRYLGRLEALRRVPAAVRFLSAEPLLGLLRPLNLRGMDWLIAGGESQSGARPAALEWFRELRDQSVHAGVPFFLKQLGGHPNKRGGDRAVLDGRCWRQWPGSCEEASLPIRPHRADLLPIVGAARVL